MLASEMNIARTFNGSTKKYGFRELGSRLVDRQSQSTMVAARAMAEKKVLANLS